MEWEVFVEQAEGLVKASRDMLGFQWQWVDGGSALQGQRCVEMRTVRTEGGQVYTLTVSIVWSPVYSVPVLFFRACDLSGSPLSLSQLLCPLLSESARDSDSTLRWGLLSAAEHPVTGEPFYSVHPCESAGLLGEGRSLIRWMSVALQLLNVRVPIRLAGRLGRRSDGYAVI